jgi:hypothetical protein
VVEEVPDLVEEGLALAPVGLPGRPLVHGVDIGIAAVHAYVPSRDTIVGMRVAALP